MNINSNFSCINSWQLFTFPTISIQKLLTPGEGFSLKKIYPKIPVQIFQE